MGAGGWERDRERERERREREREEREEEVGRARRPDRESGGQAAGCTDWVTPPGPGRLLLLLPPTRTRRVDTLSEIPQHWAPKEGERKKEREKWRISIVGPSSDLFVRAVGYEAAIVWRGSSLVGLLIRLWVWLLKVSSQRAKTFAYLSWNWLIFGGRIQLGVEETLGLKVTGGYFLKVLKATLVYFLLYLVYLNTRRFKYTGFFLKSYYMVRKMKALPTFKVDVLHHQA